MCVGGGSKSPVMFAGAGSESRPTYTITVSAMNPSPAPVSQNPKEMLDGNIYIEFTSKGRQGRGPRNYKVYLSRSLDFFKTCVGGSMGFFLYKIRDTGEHIIALTNWQDGEQFSSHGIINDAISGASLFGYLEEVDGGYLMSFKGDYLIYELRNESLYNNRGSFFNIDYRGGICPESLAVAEAFEQALGIRPIFPILKDYSEAMRISSTSRGNAAQRVRNFWERLSW